MQLTKIGLCLGTGRIKIWHEKNQQPTLLQRGNDRLSNNLTIHLIKRTTIQPRPIIEIYYKQYSKMEKHTIGRILSIMPRSTLSRTTCQEPKSDWNYQKITRTHWKKLMNFRPKTKILRYIS